MSLENVSIKDTLTLTTISTLKNANLQMHA